MTAARQDDPFIRASPGRLRLHGLQIMAMLPSSAVDSPWCLPGWSVTF